jgi:hypothetical protein
VLNVWLGFLQAFFLAFSLLLFSSLDLSGGTFQTNPRTTFRASCDGHPYPFASSLFCAIHSSAASMSEELRGSHARDNGHRRLPV